VAPLRPIRRSGSLRLASAVVSLVALTTTGAVVSSAPASADSLKARIAAAHHQLTALNAKAEAASERYNAARLQLATDQRSAASAQHRLATSQRTLARMQKSVQAFAVAAYQGQTLDTTMSVTADSPQEFLDKMTTLQAVANSQSQTLAGLAGAQRDEEQAQATATAALQAQQDSTKQMQADRDAVVAAAHQAQQILGQLEERQRQIIAAARARAARLAAEREVARLAAERAAAAAAVSALYSQPTSSPVVTGSGGARVAVEWAYKEIGKPYQWGAAGPDSFDCSGLTQYVWGKAGVYLDHYTGSQWNEGQHVSRDQLQPGDLVFFGSDLHHVGLYVGNSNMIEAPYTGANVRVSYAFRSDYAGAIRPGT
jgi:cell wall-associated NlpC family hydrolase